MVTQSECLFCGYNRYYLLDFLEHYKLDFSLIFDSWSFTYDRKVQVC